jgi:hypothetical protein
MKGLLFRGLSADRIDEFSVADGAILYCRLRIDMKLSAVGSSETVLVNRSIQIDTILFLL